jgi:CelD/BcsL family acetyltransferase involved in cellulose biosynthesis
MLTCERIGSVDEFASLRTEWNALLQDSSSNCVFLTHEWLFTWWKHLREDRALSILTVRDNGNLVGILPLAIRDAQYARMTPRILEFLGAGVIGSDYLDVIVKRGREQEVARVFAHELNRRGLMLQLSQLRKESCLAAALGQTLRDGGWTAAEVQINICPFIRLDGHTWDSYLATVGSSHRYNFNRRLRNLTKNPEFRVETLQNPADAARGLDLVIHLHRKRWDSTGNSEAFQTPDVVAFHQEFAGLAAQQGWLRIVVMWVSDAPVAALYGLQYGATFYFYQSGFDPAYSKQSVGLVMMGVAIKTALEEGASEYDLLHGNEEYKFHWTQEVHALSRLEIYPPHTKGRIYRHAIALNRAARQMAKRVLNNSL